MIITV